MSEKKVALVGFYPDTRHLAPYDDPEWEIWGCNEAYNAGFMKRWTRWFQMHQRWDFTKPKNDGDPLHYEWLRMPHDFPIYMQKVWEDIPASVEYPLQDIIGETGVERVFTSTFDYMLALAIHEGFTTIGVYGFEMATDTEFRYQRPGAYFWMGYAKAKGAEFVLPDETSWLKQSRYAYEVSQMINRQRLETHRAQLMAEHAQAAAEMQQAIGQLKELERVMQGKEKVKAFQKRHDELKAEAAKLTGVANAKMGAQMFCDYLIRECDLLTGVPVKEADDGQEGA